MPIWLINRSTVQRATSQPFEGSRSHIVRAETGDEPVARPLASDQCGQLLITQRDGSAGARMRRRTSTGRSGSRAR